MPNHVKIIRNTGKLYHTWISAAERFWPGSHASALKTDMNPEDTKASDSIVLVLSSWAALKDIKLWRVETLLEKGQCIPEPLVNPMNINKKIRNPRNLLIQNKSRNLFSNTQLWSDIKLEMNKLGKKIQTVWIRLQMDTL